MRISVSFLIAALAVYACLCGIMFLTQRSQIYFPPAESHAPGARDVRLERDGVTLKLWVVPRDGPRALIYFGGNAEDVAGDISGFTRAFPHHSLYLVNYRGYGGSTGKPTERGLYADARAVHEYVAARHPSIDVMGRSLGAGVAVHLASERPVSRLVLVTPFDSLVSVARNYFRFFPVGLLLRDRYDAARHAAAVTAPVLVVIAGEDEIIPRARSDALASAFPTGQARVAVIDHAMHNSLDLSPEYLGTVQAFLNGP